MTEPYVGFGDDKLKKCPAAHDGMEIECFRCGKTHTLKMHDSDQGTKTVMGTYRCGGKAYLGAVMGKLVANVNPCVKGKI